MEGIKNVSSDESFDSPRGGRISQSAGEKGRKFGGDVGWRSGRSFVIEAAKLCSCFCVDFQVVGQLLPVFVKVRE